MNCCSSGSTMSVTKLLAVRGAKVRQHEVRLECPRIRKNKEWIDCFYIGMQHEGQLQLQLRQ